jgi:hypothetical protein
MPSLNPPKKMQKLRNRQRPGTINLLKSFFPTQHIQIRHLNDFVRLPRAAGEDLTTQRITRPTPYKQESQV